MEHELIQAVDGNRRPIGIFPRAEIHRQGFLHETFHCWLVRRGEVFVQIRSAGKKDFPGLLDVTAAGHLLANEQPEDGIRELHEELGLKVRPADLIPLGVIRDDIELPGFIDREWAHVFLLPVPERVRFILQKEEVEAVERLTLDQFASLVGGSVVRLANGRSVSKTDVVPHSDHYLEQVIKGMRDRVVREWTERSSQSES
ncbi:NUDIX hydrolase [Indiicoccus explosivorum]|uniref:NUDIX hydrolase n=1 Tax=Indiicoccus explosivorum TaxID=1917864 RepID=UPI000B4414D2|nr:NUDIX domain-containing protein [Indiicoccus explosivorum]